MYNIMNSKFYEFVQKTILKFGNERGIEKMWKAPLMALVPADHPQMTLLKQVVCADHFLPEELLEDAKSIIAMFVPFEDRIAESNIEGETASEDWAKAYVYTNELLNHVTAETGTYLNEQGFRTFIIKATHNFFNEKTLLSRWSHRHIAWMAGLGTFGINNMLITEKGCCGRFSSFLTNAGCKELDLPVGNIKVSENCLNKRNGSCGLCQKKCPIKAYLKQGSFDRHKCYEVCKKNAVCFKHIGLADVCGKCLAGLPCSSKAPV